MIEKLAFGQKEKLVVSYYVISIGSVVLLHGILPNPAHAPGVGVMLFFLLIPMSILYGLIHFFKWAFSEDDYRFCLIVHVSIWVAVFLTIWMLI